MKRNPKFTVVSTIIFGTVIACATSLFGEDKVFDVRELGAKGDGKTLDTAAIQKAIDQCGEAGGGIVRLPSGTYLSKPIFLRSNLTLQLDEGAKLLATDEPGDFANPQRPNAVIAFINGDKLHERRNLFPSKTNRVVG